MSVQIRYKNTSSENSLNKVFFVDEKYRILALKKYLSLKEYNMISDLIKSKETNKKMLSFDISSKIKIILVGRTIFCFFNKNKKILFHISLN